MLASALASPPTHFYVPDGAHFTLADEVADLMVAIGFQVDEPERLACHALYATDARGAWIGLESGIVSPRQNLKTATMLAGALHDTFVQGVERVVWTAHEFKTSSDAFKDLQAIIEGHDWLASEVLAVRTANGKEGFDLRSGSRLDVLARTGKSGRGMGSPRLYLDEGLYLEAKMMGAIVPVVSARRNPHIVYGSSPGLQSSEILRGLRQRGRSGTDPNLGWIEWSQERGDCAQDRCSHEPGTPGCWLDSIDAVLRVNPAAGRRISLDYLRQERLTLSAAPDEYLRERMGVWDDPPEGGAEVVYPLEPWQAGLDAESEVGASGFLVFGVDVSWDRETAYVAVVGYRDDDLIHGQLIHTCSPADVAAFLEERVARFRPAAVALQGGGSPVASLTEEIVRAIDGQCEVRELTGADISRACGVTHDVIKSERLRHHGQPALDHALRRAASRPLGDGWALDRKKSPIDIAPLVALTNAIYVLTTTEQGGDPGVWFL